MSSSEAVIQFYNSSEFVAQRSCYFSGVVKTIRQGKQLPVEEKQYSIVRIPCSVKRDQRHYYWIIEVLYHLL